MKLQWVVNICSSLLYYCIEYLSPCSSVFDSIQYRPIFQTCLTWGYPVALRNTESGQKWVYSCDYAEQFILVWSLNNYCNSHMTDCQPTFAPPCTITLQLSFWWLQVIILLKMLVFHILINGKNLLNKICLMCIILSCTHPCGVGVL